MIRRKRVPLTGPQIKSILDDIPKPPGVGKWAVNIARDQNIKLLRDYLEDPSSQILLPENVPEAFQEFKEKLIESIYLSFIEAGSPIGVLAATAVGNPLTQLTMNTFHFAGQQSGVASAFNQVRDFLSGTRTDKNPSMKIFLKDPSTGTNLHDVLHVGTVQSIYAMRPEIEETTVKDLILSHEILTREEALRDGVAPMITLASRLYPERFQNAEMKFLLTYVLELEVDLYRMYTHRITMRELATGIEGHFPPDSLSCVWRSQLEGRMYVLVDEQRDYGFSTVTHQNAILMFLDQKVIPSFDKWTVKGIRGISGIEPREINVIDGIDRVIDLERKTIYGIGTGKQIVKMSQRKTRTEGVSLYDVYRLLVVTGFHVLSLDQGTLEIVVQHEGDLLEDLRARIREGQKKQDSSIISGATFAYILTRGTNYEEIIWRDDIDLYRSQPMNSHEIVALLGIDAARSFLISELGETLTQFSSYINKRHIDVMFDLLTNLGLVNSLSFAGVNRKALGPMTAASHQRSMEVFTNSSIFGDKEKILGISSAMYVGQKSSQIGTGSIGVVSVEDRPSLPPSDEIIQEELLIEEPDFRKFLEDRGYEGRGNEPGRVDFKKILEKSEIVDKVEIPQPSLLESTNQVPGTQDIITSTLQSALAKVTSGTNIQFTQETSELLPEITEETDILDLFEPVSRGKPLPVPSAPFDVLGTLLPPISSVPPAPGPSAPTPPVPLAPTSMPPVSVPSVPGPPASLVLPVIESIVSLGPKATVTEIPPPRPLPPPKVPVPRPPRSIVSLPAHPVLGFSGAEFDFASFIAQLPASQPQISQPQASRPVQPINYETFLQALR